MRISTEKFIAFSEPMEGIVYWMYADTLGLVTIGLGNLIDSKEAARHLPTQGGGLLPQERCVGYKCGHRCRLGTGKGRSLAEG